MYTEDRKLLGLLDRAIITTLLVLGVLLVGDRIARSAEIVPAVGLTKSVDGDEAKSFGSLALRGALLPILKSEIGVAYRSESRFDDKLKIRTWPVTASLWVTPLPSLYAGAGVGWYHVTYDYAQDRIPVPVEDETKQEFGVHLGGGLIAPLGPSVGLDLHGRYVMMRDQQSRLVPETFDPDFWTTSLGLAIRF
jgi:opacity protein-like surface antigen